MLKSENKKVLFLGVGGVSMHQLAIAFKNLGCVVLGYDLKESKYTKQCKEKGIKITNKFDRTFLNVDFCIKTAAIKENNIYVKELKKSGCEIFDRAEALSFLASKFKNVIAIAGTHGKSTTSSLIYEILKSAGYKISCHIGADVFNSRFDLNDDYLVVEACEFNKSFLHLSPTISVVTNVEPEHLDCYGSFFNLKNAFYTFTKRAKKRFAFKEKSTEFLSKIKNIEFVDITNYPISPRIKGEYNLKNISLAIRVSEFLGVNKQIIINTVNLFNGIPRRNEFIGTFNKTKIFIDYAHHPTEVKSFLNMFNSNFDNNLIVFQPHTFSRTKQFLSEFIKIFSEIKNLIIFKEYSARETKSNGISAYELFKEIKKVNKNVKYAASAKQVKKQINDFLAVAFVGAGDINLIAEQLVKNKKLNV